MKYELEHIVRALKEARERKGLSQRTLSRQCGAPQGQISKIEKGAVDLRVSSLIALARALDLELSLVPRKSLPAVNAIIRSSEGKRRPSKHSAKHSNDWEQFLNVVRSKIAEEPERKEYAQINRYLRDLHNLSQSIDWNFKKSFKVDNIKQFKSKLDDEEQCKSLVAFLRKVRNEYAQHIDDKRGPEEVKPAYSLDEDDNDG